MKQSEKADIILKWLYERRHKEFIGKSLEKLMQELGIFESRADAERIEEKLRSQNLVNIAGIEDGAGIIITITDQGVDYCEKDSYSQPGQPITSLHLHFERDVYIDNSIIGNNNSANHQSILQPGTGDKAIDKG